MKDFLSRKWKWAIWVVMLLVSKNTFAQIAKKEVEVTGVVLSRTENVFLVGSTVVVKDVNGKVINAVVTGVDGSFKARIKAFSKVNIGINYIGFSDYSSGVIELKEENVDLGRLYLQEKSAALREVTVVANRKRPLVEIRKGKIIYNAASDISNKSGNAADVLRKAPMLTVSASGELKLRGNSNIKVLINGIPSPVMAKNLKEALKMIPASSIVSVEVITNPSSKYEAEGAAGVINIVTKKKLKGTGGTIDLTGGNLEQTGNVSLNLSSGKFSFTAMGNVSVEREKTGYSLDRTNISKGERIGSLLQSLEMTQITKGAAANLSAQYKIDSLQTLEGSFSFWNGTWPQKGELYNRFIGSNQMQEYRQKVQQQGRFNFLEWVLNYQKKFRREGQELQVIGQSTYSSDVSNYITEQYKPDGSIAFREQRPNNGNEKEWSIQADYLQPLGPGEKTKLETGVKYLSNDAKSTFEVVNSSRPADPSRSGSMKYRQDIFSAYATLNFELGHDWTLRPGIRFENTGINASFQNGSPYSRKFSNLIPNLLIVKKVGEQQEVKLDYNERIRRPWIMDLNPFINAGDPLNIMQGNPYLRPELTRKIELSHTYTGEDETLFISSIYYSTNKNAVEQIARVDEKGVSYTKPDNIGESTRMGLNVNTVFSPLKNWTVNAGAELFHSKFRSKALGVENNGTFFNTAVSNTITLKKQIQFSASADYGNGFITLQGKNSANYSYRFAVKKDFINNRASLTLTVINPFQSSFKETVYAFAPTFQSTQINRFYNRGATLTFSWQFGGLHAERERESESHFAEQADEKFKRGRRR